MIPPPTPCTARAATNGAMCQARPAASRPAAKIPTPASSATRGPRRSPTSPPTTIPTTEATRKALKRGLADERLIQETVSVMTTLNRDAASAAIAAGASAMTDVTGFGLLGHAHELAEASAVSLEIEAAVVPAIEGVMDLLDLDEPPIAGGTRRNRDWVEEFVDWDDAVPEPLRWLLCDAMTSGGLLVAAADGPGTRIGRVTEGGAAGRIRVV